MATVKKNDGKRNYRMTDQKRWLGRKREKNTWIERQIIKDKLEQSINRSIKVTPAEGLKKLYVPFFFSLFPS